MIESVLEAVPAGSRALCEQILAQPLVAPAALRTRVARYHLTVDRASRDSDEVDANLSQLLAKACSGLLDDLKEGADPDHHRLVQLACVYFVEQDDDDGDLGSAMGFEDDAAVLNAVARALGRDDLCIAP